MTLQKIVGLWTQPRTIVVTPNQRLTLYSRTLYDDFQRTGGSCLWETLESYPLNTWLLKLWQTLQDIENHKQAHLLNTPQTQLVWEQLISASDAALLPLTQNIYQAWVLAKLWQIDLTSDIFESNEETQLWQKLALSFKQLLEKNHWCDEASAIIEIQDQLPKLQQHKILPDRLCLFNFTDFTPLQNKLLHLLANNGVEIIHQHLYCNNSQARKLILSDPESEIKAMVQWACSMPATQKIACVIPDLVAKREQLKQLFIDYIGDASCLNISYGKSLSDYPLIGHALLALQLIKPDITVTNLSQFLLSPFFIQHESESQARAILDKSLRSNINMIILHFDLLKYLKRYKNTETLHQCFQTLIKECSSLPQQQSLLAWADFFQRQLHCLGWPGSRPLLSEEFQLLAQWHTLLQTFSTLNDIHDKWDLNEALQKLMQLASMSLFQPKASPSSNIHVLGILEAAGLQFDAMWVMGVHDNQWPPSVTVNPFLPRSLQKELGTPHSSIEQEFTFCQAITQQLAKAAPIVYFSYANNDQEKINRESVLIKSYLVCENVNLFTPKMTIAEQMLGKMSLDATHDNVAPALEITTIKHRGSQIFKDQAACPFRAFAKHRLGASGIDLPPLGFRALQRGQLVHSVLENVWQELQSHQNLCQLSEMDLHDVIHQCIDKTFISTLYPVQPFLINIEKERLQHLLALWLNTEKQRECFVVVATEKTINTTFSGIPLKLRLDRIDEIASHQYVILDYKTSHCSTQDWFGDRLDEPQLPLYAIVSALPVSTIAFAQVRVNEMKFKSVELKIDYLKQWENDLSGLAKEYLEGHAAVVPKYGDETCRHCDLQALCRVKSTV